MTTCPFCGAALGASEPRPATRRSRTAMLVGVAAIGVACSSGSTPDDGGAQDGADQDHSVQPAYGAVIPDGGTDTGGIAMYGGPPPSDAGNG